jgi:hypothetical protein
MKRPEDGIATYFEAVRGMRSNDAPIRRSAISTLLELARQSQEPVATHAARALAREFGPYVVTDGLGGCSAAFDFVETCNGDCGVCAWLWEGQPTSSLLDTCGPVAEVAPMLTGSSS